MTYTVRFIDGSETIITESEYRNLAGKSGLVFIPSLSQTMNMSSISRIFPVGAAGSTDHTFGILHDGTNVIRQFGQWFDMSGGRNEKGYYEVALDPRYYPETVLDTVPSVEEYRQLYAHLPTEERKKLMVGSHTGRYEYKRGRIGGMRAIGELLPT